METICCLPDSTAILGANAPAFQQMVGAMIDGSLPPRNLDPEEMDYVSLAPEHIAVADVA